MATIQIELTSACVLKCSNCTRFCGTHKVPFFLDQDLFKQAIDSLVDWVRDPRWQQGIVGFMGGEPLLHPQFEEFCEYAAKKIGPERLGLWSVFPTTKPKFREYRGTICKTFHNILLNDHTRDDIFHAPILVASEEVIRKPCSFCEGKGEDSSGLHDHCPICQGKGTVPDLDEIWLRTERCWIQESWSAAINPKGAWFCEVAAALSDLFDGPMGWNVEGGWWKATPKDFAQQREWACRRCGAALPLARRRISQDPADDVSPENLERLKALGSKKVARGEFRIMGQDEEHPVVWDEEWKRDHGYPKQTYKDMDYRQAIAAKYGIVLTINQRGYWQPHLEEDVAARKVPDKAVRDVKPDLHTQWSREFGERISHALETTSV